MENKHSNKSAATFRWLGAVITGTVSMYAAWACDAPAWMYLVIAIASLFIGPILFAILPGVFRLLWSVVKICRIGVLEHGCGPYFMFAAIGLLFTFDLISRAAYLTGLIACVAWSVYDTSERRHAETLKAIRESKS